MLVDLSREEVEVLGAFAQAFSELAEKTGDPKLNEARPLLDAGCSKLRSALEGTDGFEHCHRCGRGNTVWFAPSPLWNAVMRGGSIDGDPLYNDLVCATCFMELAEAAGVASRFKVFAEQVNVELETTTPSGRIWDEDRQLWSDAPAKEPTQ